MAVHISRDLLIDGEPVATGNLAVVLHNLGAAHTSAGDDRAGRVATSQAVDLLRSLPPSDDQSAQLALAPTNQALAFLNLAATEDAELATNEAVALLPSLTQETSAEYDPDLLMALSTLSTARARRQAHEGSLESQREAVAVARRIDATNPERTHDSLARHLRILATRLDQSGMHEEAARARAEANRVRQSGRSEA